MKKNRLSIVINAPVVTVFEFTTNPANTPRWIEHIEYEEVNRTPIKAGAIYRNRSSYQACW